MRAGKQVNAGDEESGGDTDNGRGLFLTYSFSLDSAYKGERNGLHEGQKWRGLNCNKRPWNANTSLSISIKIVLSPTRR